MNVYERTARGALYAIIVIALSFGVDAVTHAIGFAPASESIMGAVIFTAVRVETVAMIAWLILAVLMLRGLGSHSVWRWVIGALVGIFTLYAAAFVGSFALYARQEAGGISVYIAGYVAAWLSISAWIATGLPNGEPRSATP